MHGRKHLYFLDGIESESSRDAIRDDLKDSVNGYIWFVDGNKIEICLTIGWMQIRYLPAVDSMSSLDDLTFRSLTKDLRKTNRGYRARID
jgi:hypothetical protein